MTNITSSVPVVQYGNNGVEIRIRLRSPDGEVLDLSGVFDSEGGEVWVLVQRPNGSTLRKSGVLKAGGADGRVSCVLNATDLDDLGMYKLQVYVKTSTSAYTSKVTHFEVVPNVDSLF